MGNKQPELGSKSQLFRRLGVDIDAWKGVNKEADPSAIREDELQDGINIRIMPNGSIKNRDGLSKAFTSALGDCVTLIADDEYDNFGTLYYDAETGGGSFDFHSADRDGTVTTPFTNALQVGNANESRRWAVIFRGELFAYKSNQLYSMDFVSGTATLRATVGSSVTDNTRPNSAAVVKGAAVDGGDRLYLAANGGTVWYWDGEGHNVIEDDNGLGAFGGTGSGHGAFLFYYAGDLIYTNTDIVRKRNGGAWDSVAIPGSVTEWQPMDMVGYKNKLYILGVDALGAGNYLSTILVYNNSTLTVAHTLPNAGTGGGGPEGVSAGVSAFGYLYFHWLDPINNNGDSYIGRYDGTTWIDTHKNLTTQFGFNGIRVTRLQLANGHIYAGGAEAEITKVFRSPGTNVSGTWVAVETNADNVQWAKDLIVVPRSG
jgi:hypothetical protein